MAVYAVGDIQGCHATFLRLLERIRFDPDEDRLWLAGDLVNRGPRSAEVLRWMVAHQSCVTAVLGNHDLYLLGRAAGVVRPKGKDTLDEILRAADRARLLDWLAAQPLLVRDGDRVLVHAGLLPAWTAEEAEARARRAERLLRKKHRDALLSHIGARGKALRRLPGKIREAVESIEVLTTLRTVDKKGHPEREFKGPPSNAPGGHVAWFEAPARRTTPVTVVFGHWASLGFYRAPGIIALDSGCVWGGVLTAVRMDDEVVFQEPLADDVE